ERRNVGQHSASPGIADTEEAAGSNPAAPTICRLTSGNVGPGSPRSSGHSRSGPAHRTRAHDLPDSALGNGPRMALTGPVTLLASFEHHLHATNRAARTVGNPGPPLIHALAAMLDRLRVRIAVQLCRVHPQQRARQPL